MTDESGTWNRPERIPADSPENKCPTVECPDCGGMGADEGGFRGGKKWKAICPRCGGSGRINTSAEEAQNQGEHDRRDTEVSHSVSEGELRARIQELEDERDGLNREIENFTDEIERLRSLLVPKGEA